MPSLRKRPRTSFVRLAGAAPTVVSWNGTGMTLLVGQNALMPQTANGTMILGWVNVGTLNNSGTLGVSSGGSAPSFVTAPANVQQPSMWMNNWQANNLNVSNVSANNDTPIYIFAYGPGVPGQSSINLPTSSQGVSLAPSQSAMGKTAPQWMQLQMVSNTPSLCIFAIIGGPVDSSGNNGYVFAVNATTNSGPGGPTPPAGYYATTTSNSYTFQFNWAGASVYVVNMSPYTASVAKVVLIAL